MYLKSTIVLISVAHLLSCTGGMNSSVDAGSAADAGKVVDSGSVVDAGRVVDAGVDAGIDYEAEQAVCDAIIQALDVDLPNRFHDEGTACESVTDCTVRSSDVGCPGNPLLRLSLCSIALHEADVAAFEVEIASLQEDICELSQCLGSAQCENVELACVDTKCTFEYL